MSFRYLFALFLIATNQMTIARADNECYAKWLGGKFPPISECNLLESTLTVRIENLVDRPECLNEETLIGYKFNQKVDDDWDDSEYLDENSLVIFNSSESLCHPVNVTIALTFFDGNEEWPVHKVTYELNPTTCIDKNISDSKKEEIETKCPNLTLNAFLTTTEASSTEATTLATKIYKKIASINESEVTGAFVIFLVPKEPQPVSCSSLILCKLLPSSYCHKMH